MHSSRTWTLAVRPADVYPRATEHIDDMVTTSSSARRARPRLPHRATGSVYFDISSFPQYGRLARIDAAASRWRRPGHARRRHRCR
jgi:cysteinyl-tRNA synthetase